ncbi:signal peptidase II [Clostridium sp. HV4-5-A1G]|uniref:signal peptidase II n=1 Tax=Clostridium sp. HV4-5-A1G TaxID=2004595 RepID=UPI00123B99E0|nr:signal peptidase II [Clostridium sp. HV4-5-A1G]KAA8676214.1 signal peptidase II [Clostridium sp. HV4-5-A1G]
MSEFFSVTLNKDVVLDDSQTSQATGWSSQKILDEIIQHRITKFEELSDVNVANKKDKQIIVYSEDQQKFTTIDIGNIGDAAGLSLKQISKMGVVGNTDSPYGVDIPINTVDFKVPRVNVLQFQQGDQNVIKTLNSFSNSDSSDFESDDMIVFDDTAHLKTDYSYKMQYVGDVGTDNREYGCEIDKSIFKSIEDMQENVDGVDEYLNLTAIPKDRLLIASGDKDLSYVDNIDYFKIAATGINIKIVASVDSGVTWKTFNADHWEDIKLAVDDVKARGMSIATFNAINSTYWNLLNTNKKIRFSYLLSMDSISDVENIDNLELQYDGKGKWVQAKEDTYDVIYASNTQLQVFLKFSGDVKINY